MIVKFSRRFVCSSSDNITWAEPGPGHHAIFRRPGGSLAGAMTSVGAVPASAADTVLLPRDASYCFLLLSTSTWPCFYLLLFAFFESLLSKHSFTGQNWVLWQKNHFQQPLVCLKKYYLWLWRECAPLTQEENRMSVHFFLCMNCGGADTDVQGWILSPSADCMNIVKCE